MDCVICGALLAGGLVPWVSDAIVVLRHDCSHSRFFCQSCKSKSSSSCGFKATEQWLIQQVHVLLPGL
ncbi:transposase zinc-binding domain-containing protein [Arsenophonus sp.]|uniref:transposase zinc-binding domain-containing protein n=1 Tax=Arsenophonus sp. TaxID=1872640 RepID=UPI00286182A4|nr:transposase zinc-binding domain-containing protein [Arsenophonus sp.]MDR5617836.1 transposase zinc-binding domain-containing protein [Arsenophonus sp.]